MTAAVVQSTLDIERPEQLVTYLRRTGRIGAGESPMMEVLTGGVSNRTVLVTRAGGEAWVVKQALPKLRVDVDWFSDTDRIHCEALGLQWLQMLCGESATPTLIFEDPAEHLLAMAAVPRPHENWKAMLMAGRVDDDHVWQFGSMLGHIHQRSWDSKSELESLFADRSFFESLRVEPYYQYTASQCPAARDFLEELIADTRARRLCIVHGDYSPKNVLVRNGRLILLDHEVIHWGDPAFDIGFALTHLLSKAHHLGAYRRRFAEAALMFWNRYFAIFGPDAPWIDLECFTVRHTLGCLLARVAGRSTLEYLDAAERRRQESVVIGLMRQRPQRVSDLIHAFIAGV